MHILHVLEATQGGTRRHVLDLLPGLARLGYRCELVYSLRRYAPFEADAGQLRHNGILTSEIPMTHHADLKLNLRAAWQLAQHLRRSRPQVLHLHSTVAGLVGRLALKLSGLAIPCVYTPHCIAFDTGMGPFQRRSARLIEHLCSGATSHFIAVSQHEAHLLRRTVAPASKVSVVYNGVNLQELDELTGRAGPSPLGESADGQYIIGCFGRLSRQKNQEALIRSLPGLLRSVPGARLVLVGDGVQEAMLRRLASHLGVNGHITWQGDEPEARPFHAGCHVVVQPSRWEGCPYSVLEAMAAGRPVLATAVGGVPELLGQVTAPLGPRAGDLTSRLVELATRPDCARHIGREARQRVQQHFTLGEMVHETSEVYRRLSP